MYIQTGKAADFMQTGLNDADLAAYAQAEDMLWVMLEDLLKPDDRPEIWAAFPQFLSALPMFSRVVRNSHAKAVGGGVQLDIRVSIALELLLAMCEAHEGQLDIAISRLTRVVTRQNNSILAQGALFHVHGMADPQNPKYKLEGRFCAKPFLELHVLERSTHQCCASWLDKSAGDLNTTDWEQVWNSESAQAVRASIHDGSYRHCNKMACPAIQSGSLPTKEAAVEHWPTLAGLITSLETEMPAGPEDVNLAYDATCNLSCPSCRTHKVAADAATRERYSEMQERAILPMLREAKSVFITGSGDPFASKNFRQLMERLTPDAYPDLRFRIMTNAMLFTPREWEKFPALHARVQSLQISIDGASKHTHELLRRGARWEVMQENLRFAADLLAQGQVEAMYLSFTVQVDNFHEMGAAVDLADQLGVTGLYFGKMTNWGTFSPDEYAQKAVFTPTHPQYRAFLAAMADPRLRSPRVILGNLVDYLPEHALAA
ncbi:radical SAM protein [uncultured Sphingomonas sp.]|uniref:radical SAM protein n=1 Tax=uncultured Sphingomonas sp. TaxID=158754 RepID=UPI0025FEC3AC|nr:radical SAM protein [uncultured Sphingomonas sp.]